MQPAPVRVLLVEDNPGDVELVRLALLEPAGTTRFELRTVDRLEPALARLKGTGIDVILLDLGLPDSFGLETLERVRTAAPTVPVVVLTATEDPVLIQSATERGAQDYLVKGVYSRGLLTRSLRSAVQRQRMENRLREQRDVYEGVLAAQSDIGEGVVLLQGEKFAVVNDALCRMFGYSREELLALPSFFALVAPEFQAALAARWSARQGGQLENDQGEALIVRKDGTRIQIEYAAETVGPRSDRRLFALIRDITQRKAGEEAIRAATEAAEAANRAKGAFLARMSHELRTPLNAITSMTELLSDTGLDAEQERTVETIRTSTDVLLGIINDILDYSRIEAGKLPLVRAQFDLAASVEDALDLVAAQAQEKELALRYSIGPGVPLGLQGDPLRVRQVLTNLLSNAVKFTARGEISVQIDSHPVPPDRVEIQIAVRDTGIGILPADQERLFQSFTQVGASLTRAGESGTGLGLAISRSFAESMEGRIWLESTPGVGSTFHFSFRAVPVPGISSVCPRGRQEGIDGKRVLILRERPGDLDWVLPLLADWGATVLGPYLTADPRTAWSEARTADRVLLKATDAATLRSILASASGLPEFEKIPLVVISRRLSVRERMQLLEGGVAKTVLRSPVKPALLLHALREPSAGGREPSPAVPSRPTFDPTRALRQPLSILVAEDHGVSQQAVVAMLRKMGYHPTAVSTGRAAVAADARAPHDLIFMDLEMPELNGLDAAREIRQRRAGAHGLRIVAMTGHTEAARREECLASGMDDFLAKPIRAHDLTTALDGVAGPRVAGGGRAAEPAGPDPLDPPAVDPTTFAELRRLAPEGQMATFVATLVAQFLGEGAKLVDDLARAAESKDAEGICRSVHALKSDAAQVGALRLATLCAETERRAQRGALPDAIDAGKAIPGEFQRVTAELHALGSAR